MKAGCLVEASCKGPSPASVIASQVSDFREPVQEDWAAVQKSATDDRNKDETKTNAGDNAGGGENVNADEAKEDDTADAGAETFSFGRMCAFSNEVMGQKTEGRSKTCKRRGGSTECRILFLGGLIVWLDCLKLNFCLFESEAVRLSH